MSVACGESTAPTATVRPERPATSTMSEAARTTTTEVRSQSLSRMATARTRTSRAARTHASGEFHATSTWPATSASTWRS